MIYWVNAPGGRKHLTERFKTKFCGWVCSYLICHFLTFKQCILGWLCQFKMFTRSDILLWINFTFHSSGDVGVLLTSPSEMLLRSKCRCSCFSVGMRNLFLLKSLPSNAGVMNIKHPEREQDGCPAAHTELCCAFRGVEAGVHFVMWLLFLCSVRAHWSSGRGFHKQSNRKSLCL